MKISALVLCKNSSYLIMVNKFPLCTKIENTDKGKVTTRKSLAPKPCIIMDFNLDYFILEVENLVFNLPHISILGKITLRVNAIICLWFDTIIKNANAHMIMQKMSGSKLTSSLSILLLLLFSWPPARAVWQNYEVMILQTWSVTAPSLGSVANVTSYIIPVPTFKCFLDPSSSLSVSQPPLPFATLLLGCTALDLFHPRTSTFSTRALIWVHFKTLH